MVERIEYNGREVTKKQSAYIKHPDVVEVEIIPPDSIKILGYLGLRTYQRESINENPQIPQPVKAQIKYFPE